MKFICDVEGAVQCIAHGRRDGRAFWYPRNFEYVRSASRTLSVSHSSKIVGSARNFSQLYSCHLSSRNSTGNQNSRLDIFLKPPIGGPYLENNLRIFRKMFDSPELKFFKSTSEQLRFEKARRVSRRRDLNACLRM